MSADRDGGAMDDPSIQYATTRSGARVAYATQGDGQLVVMPPMTPWTLLPPQPVPDDSNFWRLADGCRLLAYDHVGTGLSQREGFDFSLDAACEELEAVIDAYRAQNVVLLGVMYGGPIVIRYAAEHPEVVRHLILRASWPSSEGPARTRLALMSGAIESGDWVSASQVTARLGWGLQGAEADAVAEGVRAAASAEVFLDYFRTVANHDVRALLGEIVVPTTVMRRRTPLAPLHENLEERTNELVRAIPGAELRLFDGEGSRWEWSTYSSFLADGGQGGLRVTPSEATAGAAAVEAVGLSAREVEVLRLLPGGMSNRAIAERLVIAESTVANHVRNVLAKTGTANRTEAGRWALRRGIDEDAVPPG